MTVVFMVFISRRPPISAATAGGSPRLRLRR
ncbi:hypothetical protein N035_016325 [Klebsiella pneumoniae EGD-HP19-C]|nr:hypothetical protein N035_016325 [Klebsiella pneumoniae EGD-HP19-C]